METTMTKYSLLVHKQTGFKAVRNNETNELIREIDNPIEYKRLRTLARNNNRIKAKNDCMRELGLVSYRNQSGTVCWE